MAQILYDVVMWIGDLLFGLVALFHSKAAKILNGRKRSRQIISDFITDPEQQVYWFHCASLGEWEQTIPVVEKLKSITHGFILVSFFSPSGFENAKRPDLIDLKIYLPSDRSNAYDAIFNKFQIRAIIFTRYDLWPNMIRSASHLHIPLFLIGAEFKEGSRYLEKASFFGKLLDRFSNISCNDITSFQLLSNAGYVNISFDGSPKIERAFDLASRPEVDESILHWKGDQKVAVAGSVWQAEIDMISHYYRKGSNLKIKWIIVPHEPSSHFIALLKNKFGDDMVLFSEMNREHSDKNVIVVDSIGHLSKLYVYADIAIVGGGFGKGIHNILEPATYGIPVIAGMNYEKFSEAITLLELGVFHPVKNLMQFMEKINGLLGDQNGLDSVKFALNQLSLNNTNVSGKISEKIINESRKHV